MLGGLGAADGPRLVREAGVALFAASVTEALGLADVDDLRDEAESGETTDGRGVAVAGEAGFAADVGVLAGAVVAGLAPGASDVLRVGAAGVVADGVRVVDGGGIEVRALLTAAVDAVLRMVVVAAGGLEAAAAVAVAFVAAAGGAALVAPAPNVPELRIYGQTISNGS